MTREHYQKMMDGLTLVRAYLKDGANTDRTIGQKLGEAQAILRTEIDFSKLEPEENPFHKIERLKGAKNE